MPRKSRATRSGVAARVAPDPDRVVTVRCEGCNKRVGLAWASDSLSGWDGLFDLHREDRQILSSYEYAHDEAEPDWSSVTCPRCGHNRQFRDAYLAAAVRRFAGGEFRLGQRVPPEPARQLGATWSW